MFVIRGKYPDSEWEDIDEFDTQEEAREMLAEYRTAYGPDWLLTVKERREKTK